MALARATAGVRGRVLRGDGEDCSGTTDALARASQQACTAGSGAGEVSAPHGYLLATFLASPDNRRDDRWGGSLENRARLTVEVIRAVKAAVDPGMAVTVRVAGREFGEPDRKSTRLNSSH